tara:strand:+ start:670 stop:1326 length:657 start_codon:yes stop_codon:yes gene_type:complete
MNIICLILARKGSVRIKNKNLVKIKNKSLVERSILFSKKIVGLDKIILSTDSQQIIKIGIKHGINSADLRPENISKSSTSSYKSAIYEINKYEKKHSKVDAIILLQPTTPFRSIVTFRKLLKIFLKDPSKPLISIKKINLMSDRLLQKRKGFVCSFISNKKPSDLYIPSGAFFLVTKKILFKNKSFTSNKMNFYEIKNTKENIDIDTYDDLNIAKKFA